jgi:hypothetical protein
MSPNTPGNREVRTPAGRVTIHGAPPAAPAPSPPSPPLNEFLPWPEPDVGGMEDVPEALLSEAQRVEDALHHVGQDVELPGEEQAPPLEADQERRDVEERWALL